MIERREFQYQCSGTGTASSVFPKRRAELNANCSNIERIASGIAGLPTPRHAAYGIPRTAP